MKDERQKYVSEKKDKKQQILRVLAQNLQELLELESIEFDGLQEIRIRTGKPFAMLYQGLEYQLPSKEERKHIISDKELKETLEYVSEYSFYAFEQEIRQGFLTIEGGHRVGLTGKAIMENRNVKNLKYISSINIRVSHEVMGCASGVLPFITKNKMPCHTLIISPPGGGKTTMLRDLVRQISDGNQWVKGCTVGVVDERSEIGGCYMGIAQNQLGMRTDILDCCPKAEGMIMLIRSMSPRVIAVDEIGSREDVQAMEYAMHCGCKLLATAHGASLEEIRRKPVLARLFLDGWFERFVVLGREGHAGDVVGIYDEQGRLCGQN